MFKVFQNEIQFLIVNFDTFKGILILKEFGNSGKFSSSVWLWKKIQIYTMCPDNICYRNFCIANTVTSMVASTVAKNSSNIQNPCKLMIKMSWS